jgi:hypothetical protein
MYPDLPLDLAAWQDLVVGNERISTHGSQSEEARFRVLAIMFMCASYSRHVP